MGKQAKADVLAGLMQPETDEEYRKRIQNVIGMKVLRKSRHKIEEGDVFCLKILRDRFHFGRVAFTNSFVNNNFFDSAIVVYIYAATSNDPAVIPELRLNDLLFPPLIISSCLWRQGHFLHLENRPFPKDPTGFRALWPNRKRERLKQHCFYHSFWKEYYDHTGTKLKSRTEPCGSYAMTLIMGVDTELRKALNLPDRADDGPGEAGLKHSTTLPDDTVNADAVAITLRIDDAGMERAGTDQAEIEDAIEGLFSTDAVGSWYASGTHADGWAEICYDINPGKYPLAAKHIRTVMDRSGLDNYSILAGQEPD